MVESRNDLRLARHDRTMASIPESPWDEVIPGLYVGGSEYGYPRGEFGAVISTYDWHHAREAWLPPSGVPHICVPFYDSADIPVDLVEYLADQVAYWHGKGEVVLVRCQAGLNRSSLIAAYYLIKHREFTPRDAIAAIRAARGEDALFNRQFREYLEALDAQD